VLVEQHKGKEIVLQTVFRQIDADIVDWHENADL
jgi:hypothetical protein